MQADRKHHGGASKAVYAYADEDAGSSAWSGSAGAIPPGLFGENLRTAGVDVNGAEIGERWAIGDELVLEVTSPPHTVRDVPAEDARASVGEALRRRRGGRARALLGREVGERPGPAIPVRAGLRPGPRRDDRAVVHGRGCATGGCGRRRRRRPAPVALAREMA
ncbi:MOSC domain-containing protein [Leifsonia sp. L25]|uniref:MOSC domain-containing protein n=1 Tax=Leifsonia sp. L25 TaxID=3423957 RepID=UPI003D695A05